MTTTDDLLPVKTLAAILQVSQPFFWKMEKEFQFERHQVSERRIKFSLSDVMERIAIHNGQTEIVVTSPDDVIFVDQQEASRRLGISVNTFRSHAARVGLTRHKIGKRCVRYRWSEVSRKLAQVQF